jgi:hypothetical protein
MTRARGGKGRRAPAPAGSRRARRFRVLPRKRGARVLVYLALTLGYVALMWFLIFPWVDRTFVNRPAI